MNKLSGWEDTIVALATAPGVGAIAVVRICGSEAFNIVNKLFPSKDLMKLPSHTIHFGLLVKDEKAIDEVLISVFKGPKSYTGEDTVEISGHGSPYVQQQIINACIEEGARAARPGEFTQRAFLNGKLDLAQAESVADLIAADSKAAQMTALHNMRGGFSTQLKMMREQLIQFAALIELELDFATEDVEFADRTQFNRLIEEISATTSSLIQSFQLGNVIRNGVSVAIVGKPNAGKSTLLNCLLKEERAIVSDIPGTTRDTIEETLNINGILFRLIDTAGIRMHSTDVIENIGIEKTREKIKSADLVVFLFDINSERWNELESQCKQFDEEKIKYLLVGNKADIQDREIIQFSGLDYIAISAKEQSGIEQLKESIYLKTVSGNVSTDQAIVTNTRHLQALKEIKKSVDVIKKGMEEHLPGDLLAIEIRTCLFHLGDITGEVTGEDKLDYIFSKFCIGK